MEYIIRKCTADDADGRGMVHYQSWKETYSGLMPAEYLDKLRLDKQIEIARKHTDNTLVAVVGEKVVGFSFTGNSISQEVSGGTLEELEMILTL